MELVTPEAVKATTIKLVIVTVTKLVVGLGKKQRMDLIQDLIAGLVLQLGSTPSSLAFTPNFLECFVDFWIWSLEILPSPVRLDRDHFLGNRKRRDKKRDPVFS